MAPFVSLVSACNYVLFQFDKHIVNMISLLYCDNETIMIIMINIINWRYQLKQYNMFIIITYEENKNSFSFFFTFFSLHL